MTDDVSKLPAWPHEPLPSAPSYDEFMYLGDLCDAYRARMEALVEYAKHNRSCLKGVGGDPAYLCDCGLDALLAACERRP